MIFKKNIFFFSFLTLLFCFISLNGFDSSGLDVKKLDRIHESLKLKHGRFDYEYPEQLITATYLSSNAKVLELGSNLGNNSLVIGKIIKDSRNLVTLETRKSAIPLLLENRDINKMKFHVVHGALSKRPLIQKGWLSEPSDQQKPGYFKVNCFTFDELQKKFKIQFDTLVVDAEGALYNILKDDPNILKNIKMVIVENDYPNIEQLHFVADLYHAYGFNLVYNGGKPLTGFNHAFYQVWKK